MKIFFAGQLAFWLFLTNACGYRLAGGRIPSKEGGSIAVPVFKNRTAEYRIEQRLTDAVRRELIQRTSYNISPELVGDLVLSGEVLKVTAVPIIFTDDGRSTAYTVSVDLNVNLTDSRDRSIIFQDNNWTFREVFELANESSAFVPEDAAAMERLARRFAETLVASIFHANR